MEGDNNNKKWRNEWENEWGLEKQTEGLTKKAVAEQNKIGEELKKESRSKKHANGECDCKCKCCKL